jgi:hypothetical protein
VFKSGKGILKSENWMPQRRRLLVSSIQIMFYVNRMVVLHG